MSNYTVDFRNIVSKKQLHTTLEKSMDLPAWYGRNLDALFDCLQEIAGTVTFLNMATVDEVLGEYAEDFRKTCMDAAAENPELQLEFHQKGLEAAAAESSQASDATEGSDPSQEDEEKDYNEESHHTVGTVRIVTTHLILRRHVPEDAPILHRDFGTDPVMYEYSGWNPYATPEMAKETVWELIDQYDDPRCFAWAIEKDGQLIGTIGAYDHDPATESIEVGISIARSQWQHGYASESLGAVLRYLVHQDGIRRVTAWCASDNIGSQKTMEKCGMWRSSVVTDGLEIEGKTYDKYIYEYRRRS